jgi:SAM-dependent methyltransferase
MPPSTVTNSTASGVRDMATTGSDVNTGEPQSSDIGPSRYAFGANWQQFVQQALSPERVHDAQRALATRLRRPDLRGLTFLDVGCGSGLHSLAAWLAGAQQVTSFDLDEQSVSATRQLWQAAGCPPNWSLQQGSILDPAFMSQLPAADVVYSWGVLHHTGALWPAVDATISRLSSSGVLYLALYCTENYVSPPPEYWLKVKQRYGHAGPLQRGWMEWAYALRYAILPDLIRRRDPWRQLRERKDRGMDYWTDVRDWLGGWPMEFASVPAVLSHAAQHQLQLLNLKTGQACAEYVFRRQGATNWWDDVLARRQTILIPRPFTSAGGHAVQAEMPALATLGDDHQEPYRSPFTLLEEGEPLVFAHARLKDIQTVGAGRYRHWQQQVIFSSRDGSDPQTNGRRYELVEW